jgi:hypothetical protein
MTKLIAWFIDFLRELWETLNERLDRDGPAARRPNAQLQAEQEAGMAAIRAALTGFDDEQVGAVAGALTPRQEFMELLVDVHDHLVAAPDPDAAIDEIDRRIWFLPEDDATGDEDVYEEDDLRGCFVVVVVAGMVMLAAMICWAVWPWE